MTIRDSVRVISYNNSSNIALVSLRIFEERKGFLIKRSSPKSSFLSGRSSVCHINTPEESSGYSGASTEEGS